MATFVFIHTLLCIPEFLGVEAWVLLRNATPTLRVHNLGLTMDGVLDEEQDYDP